MTYIRFFFSWSRWVTLTNRHPALRHIHVKTQVLTVVNIKTTVFFGMMWHRIDRYHHYEEPASSFQLYTSFPWLSSSCIIIFLPIKRTAALCANVLLWLYHGSPLHHVPFFCHLSHTYTLKKFGAGFLEHRCLYTKLHGVSYHKTAILTVLHVKIPLLKSN